MKFALKSFRRKHSQLFGNEHFEDFVTVPLKYDANGKKVKDDNTLLCLSRNTFLHHVWRDFLIKDVYEKKYKRYSRKWWTSEAKLMRSVKGEDD